MEGLPRLTFAQRRVLGVLLEKALSTPDSYPLTLSAIVTGCNQKTNREPVVDFEEGEVGRAVHELQQLELVRLAPVDSGARSNRFQHQVEERLRWARSQQAVMAELFLRGPQTVGELRTRAGRMVDFPDLASVTRLLDELASREPPHTRALPREPGRSAVRHAHTLCPEDEAPLPAAAPPAPPAGTAGSGGELEARLARLESTVQELAQQVARLQERHGAT